MVAVGRRWRSVAVLVCVLTAGCGRGRSGSSSATSQVTSPATAPVAVATTGVATTSTTVAATTTTLSAALKAQAAAAVFQAGDFPPAFKMQGDAGGGDCPASAPPDCGSLDLETVWKDLTTCLGVDDSAPAVRATSSTFKENLATQARSSVEYTSAATVAALEAAVAGPKSQQCLTKAFTADAERSKPQGATPSASVVTPLDTPAVGQKVSAFRVNVTMDLGGLKIMIFQDFVVIFNGRTVIKLFLLNPGGAFPPNLEQTLIKAVVTRAGTGPA